MKKYSLFIVSLISVATIALATETIWIHQNDRITLGIPTTMADNITLSDDGTTVNINMKDNAGSYSKVYSDIKNIVFGEKQSSVSIVFDGNDADIINPYAFQGVTIDKTGGNITITSTCSENVRYEVSGTATDGSVTFVSDSSFTLVLNNANITNSTGSAINIQSAVTATIELTDGTSSTVTDGTDGENGSLYTNGSLIFKGNGTLNLIGNTKHGIAAQKSIEVQSGSINVTSSASDGIHSGATFIMNGGYITTRQTGGDGIDGDEGTVEINNGTIDIEVATNDTKGIKADDIITINGGDIKINMPADQGKAFKTKSYMTINGGVITATATGNVVVTDNDPSYCTVIKTDGDFFMTGGTVNITSTGEAGKGFSIDGNAKFTGGNINITVSGGGAAYTNTNGKADSYAATCIKVDGNLELLGGTFNLLSTGIGGKCISTDSDAIVGDETSGPTITAKTTGAKFVEVQGTNEENTDYANPKVFKADNNMTINNGNLILSSTQDGGEGLESKNIMTINGGYININTVDDCINAANSIVVNGGKLRCISSGNDAVDSNGTLKIHGGIFIASGAKTPEGGFDCDNSANFTITGGIIVGIGGSNTKPSTSTTTQGVILYSGNLAQNAVLTLTDTNGNHILSFTNPRAVNTGGGPGNGGTSILLSSPELKTGNSYKIYTGGTATPGGTFEDLVYNGSYSAGTLKKTVSLSSIVTSVQGGGR